MSRSIGASVAFRIGVFASLATLSGAAAAQDRDPAAAQALFDSARALSEQGKFTEACAKFQESNRLDPALATQFQLGNCYEQTGRIATAWAAFLQVASMARATGQGEREKVARGRADALQARLPHLLISVPEASKTPSLEIHRNGMLVGAAQWGTPVAVDPGEVEITATAPGKQTLRQTLRLEEGKTATYSLPALAPGESAAAPVVAAATTTTSAPPPVAAPTTATPASEPPHDTAQATSHKNVGWVVALAGVGVVGVGISTTFAILAKNKANESNANCTVPGKPNACDPTGVTLRNNAIEKGNVATVAAIAGGAALAGAGLVWILSGSTAEEKHASRAAQLRASADIGTDHGAFYLLGSF